MVPVSDPCLHQERSTERKQYWGLEHNRQDWALVLAGQFPIHANQALDCSCVVHATLQLAPELQVTVQRHYFDMQQRLKVALTNECNFFTGEGYSKVKVIAQKGTHNCVTNCITTGRRSIPCYCKSACCRM